MEKDRPYPMQKCENFKRAITPMKVEIEFCEKTGSNMRCAGWSDLCPVFDLFKPIELPIDKKK